MKSSIALLTMACLGLAIQVVCRLLGYGYGDISTEILILICASHICRTLENKQ